VQNYAGNVSAVRNDTSAIYDGWKYDVGKSQAVGMAQVLIPKLDSATKRIDTVLRMGDDVASSIARYQQMYPQALKNATLAAEWNRANSITVKRTYNNSLPIQVLDMLDRALFEKNSTRVGHLFGEEGRVLNVMQSNLQANARLDQVMLSGANQLLTSLNFTTTSGWKTPGYFTIYESWRSLQEPIKQLDQCFAADKIHLDIIKSNLVNPQAADVAPVLPRYRQMLKSFSDSIGTDVRAKWDSFLASAQKDNVAQIQNVLDKLAAEPEFMEQVANSVSAGLRRGSIRSLSDMIIVMNPAALGYVDWSYKDRYHPQMLETLIVKNTGNMTDQELSLAIRNNVDGVLELAPEKLTKAVLSVEEAFRRGIVDGLGDSIVVSNALAIHGIPAGTSIEYPRDQYNFGAYIYADHPEYCLIRNVIAGRTWEDHLKHIVKTHIEFVPYLNSSIPTS